MLALVYMGALLAPQTRPIPTFPAEVELVTVDAVVLDEDENPVAGLTRDDFVVTEDGKRQEIVGFEAFGTGTPSAAEATVTVGGPMAVPEEALRSGRAFAIVVDDLRLTTAHAQAARKAAATFLERSLRAGDLVSLGATSGTAWWSARLPDGREDLLAVLGHVRGLRAEATSLDRMTDYEAYWINAYESGPPHHAPAPDRPGFTVSEESRNAESGDFTSQSIRERVKRRWQQANVCSATSCDSMVRDRAAEMDAARRANEQAALLTVRRALGALAPTRGRKSLLFLAEAMIAESTSESRSVAAAAREANTAVYFVDVRGLLALPGGGDAADPESVTSLERAAMGRESSVLETAGGRALAEETGGFSVRNTNDFAAGADRIAAESRVFYLLGFYAPEGKARDKWRKLQVSVRRAGLKVRARRGYTLRAALGDEPKPGKKAKVPALAPATSRALDSADEASAVPVRTMAYVLEPRPRSSAHVVVTAEFDPRSVPPPGTARKRFELSLLVTHRDSGRVFAFDGALTVSPAEAEGTGWQAFVHDFELPAGIAQARVVVRDPASGALGSASRRFEVPVVEAFHVSTPVLSDRVETIEGSGSRPRPVLTARRVFRPEGRLYCQFEVFGAAGQEKRAPRVAAGLSLRDGGGRVVFEAPVTPIAADPDGRVVRLLGLPLEGLSEGAYELDLDVQDEESGAWIERREPFTLLR